MYLPNSSVATEKLAACYVLRLVLTGRTSRSVRSEVLVDTVKDSSRTLETRRRRRLKGKAADWANVEFSFRVGAVGRRRPF